MKKPGAGVLLVARTVVCACGASFVTRSTQGRYCSDPCRRDGARKSWREFGERNRDDRRRYHREHYKENRDTVLERTRAYRRSDAGKRTARAKDRRQREKSPEKYAARQAVLVAVRAGRLVKQPCERCGAKKVQAHHDDYSQPLEVRWFCDPCHRTEHGRFLDTSGKVGVMLEDGAVVTTEPAEVAVA